VASEGRGEGKGERVEDVEMSESAISYIKSKRVTADRALLSPECDLLIGRRQGPRGARQKGGPGNLVYV